MPLLVYNEDSLKKKGAPMKSTFPILTAAIFISLLAGSNAAPQPTPADTPPPVVTKDSLDVELSTLHDEDAYQEQYDFLIPVPEFENQTYPWYRPYHHRGPYIPSKTKTDPEFDQVRPDEGPVAI